jgi:hypothetical protein
MKYQPAEMKIVLMKFKEALIPGRSVTLIPACLKLPLRRTK